MREREFNNRFRLATGKDSPWNRVLVKQPKPVGAAAASAILTNPTLGLKLANGAGDMLDSLTKYVSDLLRYRTPVRYFFLSTYTNKRQLFNKRVQLRTTESGDSLDSGDYQNEIVDFTNKKSNSTQTSTTLKPSNQSILSQIIQNALKYLM